MIECRDGSLYTGATNRLTKRYTAHQKGTGARYTRSHPPKQLIGSLAFGSRSQALIAEYRIKKLKPAQKLALFKNEPMDYLP